MADLGCDRGQGYLIGRSAPIEDIVGMLLTDRFDPRPLKHLPPALRVIAATAIAT
jgi:EAL domain-containing protein (putative c-di-GMP-specific phosphodiesterase class I)